MATTWRPGALRPRRGPWKALNRCFCLALLSVLLQWASPWLTPAAAQQLEPVADPHKIFVVHSYTIDNPWTADQEAGFLLGLEKFGYGPLSGKTEVTTFGLDTRQLFSTNATVAPISEAALATLARIKPKVLYVTDDAAMQHVAVPLLRNPPHGIAPGSVQVVFSGVNADLEATYPDLFPPGSTAPVPTPRSALVTGVLEKDDVTAQLKLVKQIKPTTRHIVVIGDSGVTAKHAVTNIVQQMPAAFAATNITLNTTADVHLLSTEAQLKERIAQYNNASMYDPSEYVFYFLSFWTVTDAAGVGIGASNAAVYAWIRDNNALGEVFTSIASCRFGMAIGAGPDGVDEATRSGIQAALILEGTQANNLPVQLPGQDSIAVTLNRPRLDAVAGMTFLEAPALRATTVYHELEPAGADAVAAVRPRVLIVHSYTMRYYWTEREHRGFLKGLAKWGYSASDTDIKTFYMDTKQYFTTTEDKFFMASVATMFLTQFKPRVVLISDDNALKYFAVPYMEAHPDTNTSFVFTGVNVDPITSYPSVFGTGPDGSRIGPVCGTLERSPAAAVARTIKSLKPSTTNVVLLTDQSPTGTGYVDAVGQLLNSLSASTGVSLLPTDVYKVLTTAEFQAVVTKYNKPDKASHYFLWTYAPWTLTDATGKTIGSNNAAYFNWLLENNKIGEVVEPFDVPRGFLLGGHISAVETAAASGLQAARILEGTRAQDLPVYDPGIPERYVNQLRAAHLEPYGVHLGLAEILDVDQVYHDTSQGCVPGYGGVSPICIKCDEGKIKPGFGDTSCSRCPDGTYADEPRTACVQCPSVGVSCVNGILRFESGIWTPSDVQGVTVTASTPIYECLVEGSCIVNASTAPRLETYCAEGHTGNLCANCVEGYAKLTDDRCQECFSPVVSATLATVAGLFVVVASCVIIKRSSRGRSKAAIGARMLVSFLQVMLILGSFKNHGTELFREITGASEVSSGGASFKSSWLQCALDLDYTKQFAAYMLTPVVAVVLPAIVLFLHYKLCSARAHPASAGVVSANPLADMQQSSKSAEGATLPWKARSATSRGRTSTWRSFARFATSSRKTFTQRPASYMSLYGTSVVVLLFLVYNTVSLEVFTALRCFDREVIINGKPTTLLRADLELECMGTPVSVAAIIFLVVYALGIPLAGFVLLCRNRKKLSTPSVMQRLGFLYDGYHLDRLWFWELIVNLRKLALIMLSVFWRSEPILASYWAVVAMVIALVLQVHFRPFESGTLNNLETLSISTTIVTQFGSIYFALKPDAPNLLITAVLTAINLATVVVFVVAIIRMQRRIMQKQRAAEKRRETAHEALRMRSTSAPPTKHASPGLELSGVTGKS